MNTPTPEQMLQQAIATAKRGDRVAARRLLRDIVVQEPRNEKAWLWLATTSTTREDKEKCLNRVLKINPNNVTAKNGLEQLRALDSGPAAAPTGEREALFPERGPRMGTYVLYGSILLVVALILFGLSRRDTTPRPPDQSPGEIIMLMTATANAMPTTTSTPTITPTSTLPAVFVTLSAPTLPPTYTPTPTPLPTETPLPTFTPIPLDTYGVLYGMLDTGGTGTTLAGARADGSDETRYNVTGSDLAASPDGEQVVFIAPSQDPDAQADSVELFIAPSDDLRDATQLTALDVPDLSDPTWHPGGEMITLVRGGIEIIGVRLNDPTAPPEVYITEEISGNKSDPTWANEGRILVFASDDISPGFPNIYAIDLNSGDFEQLTNSEGTNYGPAASPDGTEIVFISDRTGDGDVYLMNADGSDVRLLTSNDGTAEDLQPTWSQDGQQIVFSSNRAGGESFQIFVMTLNSAAVVQVTDGDSSHYAPVFVR